MVRDFNAQPGVTNKFPVYDPKMPLTPAQQIEFTQRFNELVDFERGRGGEIIGPQKPVPPEFDIKPKTNEGSALRVSYMKDSVPEGSFGDYVSVMQTPETRAGF